MEPSTSRLSETSSQPISSHSAQNEASTSTSLTGTLQEQFETLKKLMRDQIEDCQARMSQSEELERDKEQVRAEQEVQNEEMRGYLHGALEAQKTLASISSELAKSQDETEKIRKIVEEEQKVQKAELTAVLEGMSRKIETSWMKQVVAESFRHKRQKHQELMRNLRKG